MLALCLLRAVLGRGRAPSPSPWNGHASRVYRGCRVAAASVPCSSCRLLLVGRRRRAAPSACASCSRSAIGCWTARRAGVEARVSTAAPAPPAPPPLPLPPPRQMRLPGLGLRVCAAQRTCGLSISCAR
ncbi:hypothetical protein AURDEDRAFT_114144 [Auricularia subglabra TFB-10046 SS5]|nr:hypothetical protein AURDEDRAFT_114144 [Auricularia subglabra TFB-10046 SS5]